MKKPLFLAGLTVALSTGAILNQGCASHPPANQLVWYNPQKTELQGMADEADCRNMVRMSQNGIPVNLGGAVALYSIIAENKRENSIYSDCMVSKGYYLITTNGLALLNEIQTTENVNLFSENNKAASNLIGQWKSNVSEAPGNNHIRIKGLDFFSGNQVILTTVQSAEKTVQAKETSNVPGERIRRLNGSYCVIGDGLILYLSTPTAPLIIVHRYSLSTGALTITDKNGQFTCLTNCAGLSR